MIHNAKKLETVDKHALKDDIDVIMFSEIPSIGIKRLIRCNDALKYIFPHLFELSINAKSLFEESLVALDLSENKIEDKFAALFMNVSYHNGYDKNAIKVIADYQHIGYIKSDLAQTLAPIMDQGKIVNVKLLQVTGGGDKAYGCNIQLFI